MSPNEKQNTPGSPALLWGLVLLSTTAFPVFPKKASVNIYPQVLTFAPSERVIFPAHSRGRRKGPWGCRFTDSFVCLNRAPLSLREIILSRLCAECARPENDTSCFAGTGIKYTFTYTLPEKLGWLRGHFWIRQANIWTFCQRNRKRHWYAKKLLTEAVLLSPALMWLLCSRYSSDTRPARCPCWLPLCHQNVGLPDTWAGWVLKSQFHFPRVQGSTAIFPFERNCAYCPWGGFLLYHLSEHSFNLWSLGQLYLNAFLFWNLILF